ncbi:nucleotidyltransferase [Kitasatospora sp. NPDC096147]|uniref:nucleotidyltransferase n=1 Tax=Kitasatospora sp. NPDC096147 TaxID=3364093 RepID=UPI0038050199
MARTDHREGPDADGCFAWEGGPKRGRPEFAALVGQARAGIGRAFGPDRLHSAYRYGSVPRGTARAGRSDLDVLLALHQPPTTAPPQAGRRWTASASCSSTPRPSRATWSGTTLGWFPACLCTPLLGPDLAVGLPRYRPDSLPARETNGNRPLHLARWRAGQGTVRGSCRVTVRTAFALVMPRWGGWTRAPARSAEIAGSYDPERAGQLRAVARAALGEDGTETGAPASDGSSPRSWARGRPLSTWRCTGRRRPGPDQV